MYPTTYSGRTQIGCCWVHYCYRLILLPAIGLAYLSPVQGLCGLGAACGITPPASSQVAACVMEHCKAVPAEGAVVTTVISPQEGGWLVGWLVGFDSGNLGPFCVELAWLPCVCLGLRLQIGNWKVGCECELLNSELFILVCLYRMWQCNEAATLSAGQSGY